MGVLLKLLSCVKDSYLPAMFVLAASFFCALNTPFETHTVLSLNIIFFIACFSNLALLSLFKDLKNTFFTLILLFLYIIVAKFIATSFVSPVNIARWLMLVMPFNLFLISMIEQKQKHLFYLLCFFLAQSALIENLCLSGFGFLPHFVDIISAIFWFALFLNLLISVSMYPSIKNNAFFFECMLVFWALFNIQTPHSFLICLLAAGLSNLITNIHKIVYEHFRDSVTGFYSKNSFPAFDSKKLPPKYTIAFFCIDNYNKILQVFKKNLTDKLTVMILKRVMEVQPKALIYRLKPDEFCFIFFEQDIKQTVETVENMRRLVAGTEFVLAKKKILKLTITPVVSEKHRNDANAAVVLERMHKNFDRHYKFTQNMTFCEELEQAKKGKRTSVRSATK